MDQAAIARAAEDLSALLDRYAGESEEARQLRRALSPLLKRALNAQISSPLSRTDIPGAYSFTEGTLAQYRDLEDAMSRFRLEVTGMAERVAELMKGIPRPQ